MTDKLVCGFCGKEVTLGPSAVAIRFPDGKSKPACVSHPGVEQEFRDQLAKKE